MIYTLTLNPALDYIVTVPDFQPGRTNRTKKEQIFPGGKGINVSLVLQNLGMESIALGFTAGFTGSEIEKLLQERNCKSDFIRLSQGNSRINVKIQNINGTEINGIGPAIPPESLELLYRKLDTLTEQDILVLAGSIPASLPVDIYRQILSRLRSHAPQIVVDAEKELLLSILEFHPFLIKPNHHELGSLFQRQFHSRREVIPYARKLREMGAANVLVSMGGQGAVLAASDGRCYESPAPAGTLINAVGSGDSMVAGFLTGYMEQGEILHAFRMGIAAGSASAFSEGFASRAETEQLYCTIHSISC